MQGGCGGNCRCAGAQDVAIDASCVTDKTAIALDENGKCPCGKDEQDCCHKEELVTK